MRVSRMKKKQKRKSWCCCRGGKIRLRLIVFTQAQLWWIVETLRNQLKLINLRADTIVMCFTFLNVAVDFSGIFHESEGNFFYESFRLNENKTVSSTFESRQQNLDRAFPFLTFSEEKLFLNNEFLSLRLKRSIKFIKIADVFLPC